ncbi:hypothetical protein J3E72DRAFT_272769 [Bipolaris maydis]|nr:hypothetical protein J3E72DRAFT_272769 [Bipolaris maydis]KAJ6277384.1 hypothetical protein J3E71DRAFT_245314 [Bipolaris maydis]
MYNILKFLSTAPDIGLMNLLAGRFNFLEFSIYDMHWPLVRELANLARQTAQRANKSPTNGIGYANLFSFCPIDLSLNGDILNNPNLDDDGEWGTLMWWPGADLRSDVV